MPIDPVWMPTTDPPARPAVAAKPPYDKLPALSGLNQRAFWAAAYPSSEDLRPEKVYAFLNPWDSNPDKVNTVNTEPVYAILGNGFVATVNHATLLQTKWGRSRIGSSKVQHIGFPDPWTVYHPHNMNQFVELLTLPGYFNQPDAADFGRWLRSTVFADKNSAEVSTIAAQQSEEKVITGQVTKIEKVGDNYALTIRNRKSKLIASHIDICTGPGQTRLRNLTGVPDELISQYQNPPPGEEDVFLQLLTATNFTWERAQVIPGGLMLVLGAGPAAAQAVERALEGGGASQVLWSPKKLSDAFPPTMRLDSLVKKPSGDPLPVRLGPLDAAELWPRDPRLFVTETAWEIASVEKLTDAHIQKKGLRRAGDALKRIDYVIPGAPPPLLVTFATEKSDPSAYIDAEGVQEPSAYGIFHQIVIAQGLQDRSAEPGSTFAVLQDLLINGGIKLGPLLNDDGLSAAIGLTSDDGRIRVLGSAGHGNKLFGTLTGQDGKKLIAFEDTLPAQARIAQQGVTLSALTTAYANQYFKESAPNPSVNTACLDDLNRMTGDAALALDILSLRSCRIAPFKNLATLLGALAFYEYNRKSILPELLPDLNDDAVLEVLAGRTDGNWQGIIAGWRDKLKHCKFTYEKGNYSKKALR